MTLLMAVEFGESDWGARERVWGWGGGFARAMGGPRERRRREINTPTYYGQL